MFKYINYKNDEFIKQNGTNFYILSLFSKNIINKDKLRIQGYKSYKKNMTSISLLNIIPNTIISITLIYKFKSILILPFFYTNYFLLKWIFPTEICRCYFCERNQKRIEILENYEKIYRLIEYIFERNHNIYNITDFEKELDKVINELNI